MTDLLISSKPLNFSSCIKKIIKPENGGIASFIGTVREVTQGKKVMRLEYEAYEEMAIKEMQKIADLILDKWEVKDVLIHHRVGILDVSDVSVVIVIGASHREEALVACKYAIDTLKKTVPIFKKEVFEDGEVWVGAHS